MQWHRKVTSKISSNNFNHNQITWQVAERSFTSGIFNGWAIGESVVERSTTGWHARYIKHWNTWLRLGSTEAWCTVSTPLGHQRWLQTGFALARDPNGILSGHGLIESCSSKSRSIYMYPLHRKCGCIGVTSSVNFKIWVDDDIYRLSITHMWNGYIECWGGPRVWASITRLVRCPAAACISQGAMMQARMTWPHYWSDLDRRSKGGDILKNECP